jgi:hypothetical protein
MGHNAKGRRAGRNRTAAPQDAEGSSLAGGNDATYGIFT